MPDILRIKRRSSGGAGAPASLAYAELAYNEVNDVLYYGKGNNAGQAQTVIAIAGPGYVTPATPGGSNTQVQFNDSGVFAGDAGLTYDKNTDTLTAGDIKVAQWNGVSAPVELKLQSTAGQWGTSILRIKNETGVNGAMFETIPNSGAELVDFVFKVGTITQQNIRLEARPSGLTSGNSWEFQIGSAGNAQCVIGNSITRTQLLSVKSDGTLNVSISGQTTFQYDPNTNNGTFTLGAKPPHGQVLKFCARSDINGSATFFGAANYNFDAGLFVTGAVQVNADPTTDLQLATKRYVDSKAGGGSAIAVGDTPPATPQDSSLWWETDSGILWLRYNDSTSTQWIAISGPPGPSSGLFLPLNGGTLSGPLVINQNTVASLITAPANLAIVGSDSASAFVRIEGYGGNLPLIAMNGARGPASAPTAIQNGDWFGQVSAQGRHTSGYGVHTGFRCVAVENWTATANGSALVFFTTTPGALTSVNSLVLNANTATFSTQLILTAPQSTLIQPSSGWAVLTFSATAGNRMSIYGNRVNSTRWELQLCNESTESGSNVGSNFVIARYSDAGAYIDNCLIINRSTGSLQVTRFSEYGFSPGSSQVDNAAVKASGSYGGGFVLQDGTGRCGIWCDGTGANLRFGIGNATSLTVPAYFTSSATYNSTGVWATTSDASLKSNIQDYTRGLADLVMLRPVTFTFTQGTPFADPDETPRIGLIAQEVEPYVPEIVGEVEATIGEELVPVKTLESGSLIFAVLNALREIDERLRNLEAKL